MKTLEDRIKNLNWKEIKEELLEKGFVVTKSFLSKSDCDELKSLFDKDELYRSTIDMKRYNFGKGSYRYFKYPLPKSVQTLREEIYEEIVPVANSWSERTKSKVEFPPKFSQFLKILREKGQTRSTPLILHYTAGDFNCLHQDIANDLIFPYQVVFGLSESGKDYEGGQLILTQQRPRMQTVPHIITIPKGAAVIFASNSHAQLGKRGYYRTVFKHGVGKIETGDRYTLGVVFHDYREKKAVADSASDEETL